MFKVVALKVAIPPTATAVVPDAMDPIEGVRVMLSVEPVPVVIRLPKVSST